mmetsp:Transcript_2884/g.3259  ORF Transcript_2884/g.3259 Transcript_2884/m.3259 type:complete len:201 (+) Transcript_2884:429-1031(+)
MKADHQCVLNFETVTNLKLNLPMLLDESEITICHSVDDPDDFPVLLGQFLLTVSVKVSVQIPSDECITRDHSSVSTNCQSLLFLLSQTLHNQLGNPFKFLSRDAVLLPRGLHTKLILDIRLPNQTCFRSILILLWSCIIVVDITLIVIIVILILIFGQIDLAFLHLRQRIMVNFVGFFHMNCVDVVRESKFGNTFRQSDQ